MYIDIVNIRTIQVIGYRNVETGVLRVDGVNEWLDDWPDEIIFKQFPNYYFTLEETDDNFGEVDEDGEKYELADYVLTSKNL